MKSISSILNQAVKGIEMKKNKQNSFIFITGLCIGAIIFLAIFGWRVLDITYVDWTYSNMKGDLIQHQLGFEFFYNAPWKWPIGYYDTNLYPFGTSVMYSDSIPLFAIIFKLLRPVLPGGSIQFLGLFGFMCFALQGGFGSIILAKKLKNRVCIGLGTVLIVMSFVLFARIFNHTALSAHFIILAVFAFWLYKDKFQSLRSRIIFWIGIMSLSVLIQFYFVGMLLVLMLGFIIDDWIDYKKIHRQLCIIAGSIVSIFGTMYLIGGFSTSTSGATEGLGLYAMNLNAFFNPGIPMGKYDYILPTLPTLSGQYEGNMYLGLGILLLLSFLLIYWIVQSIRSKKVVKIWKSNINKGTVIFCIAALTFWATMPVITFNSFTIFDLTQYNGFKHFMIFFGVMAIIILNYILIKKTSIRLKYKLTINLCCLVFGALITKVLLMTFLQWEPIIFNLFSIFRSSGRFGWPIVYFIIILCILKLADVIKSKRKYAVLSGILVLVIAVQVIDFMPKIITLGDRTPSNAAFKPTLKSEIWEEIGSSAKHIQMLSSRTNVIPRCMEIEQFAVHNGLTMGAGYFSRVNDDDVAKDRDAVIHNLLNGDMPADTVYVITDEDLLTAYLNIPIQNDVQIAHADGFNLIISNKLLTIDKDSAVYADHLHSTVDLAKILNAQSDAYNKKTKEFTLDKGSAVGFGNCVLYAGNYELTIEGSGLSELACNLRNNDNMKEITITENKLGTENIRTFEFNLDSDLSTPVFILTNLSLDNNAVLKKVEFQAVK